MKKQLEGILCTAINVKSYEGFNTFFTELGFLAVVSYEVNIFELNFFVIAGGRKT